MRSGLSKKAKLPSQQYVLPRAASGRPVAPKRQCALSELGVGARSPRSMTVTASACTTHVVKVAFLPNVVRFTGDRSVRREPCGAGDML